MIFLVINEGKLYCTMPDEETCENVNVFTHRTDHRQISDSPIKYLQILKGR